MQYDHYIEDTPKKWEHHWMARPLPVNKQSFPLVIENIGFGRWRSDVSYSRARSMDFVAEYVCRGNVLFIQDGQEYLVQPGEVYLLRKNVAHVYSTGPAEVAVKRFVQIGGPGLDSYLRLLGLWKRDYIRLERPHRFRQLLRRITHLISHASTGEDLQRDTQLSCLAYQLLLELSQSLQQPAPPLIEKALKFLHANLHRPLTRDELCAYLGVSMPYFNRIFAAYMDCTPIAYFLEQKFIWTTQLLKTTGLTVKEIAYRAGFEDPLYFSAQFKKRFGSSPRHYRQAK